MGRATSRGSRIGLYISLAVLSIVLLLSLLPFGVVALNAFKTPADYAAFGPLSLPRHPTLSIVVDFWKRVDFGTKLWNSFYISACVALFGVALSLLNAYALGIGRVRGRTAFLILFVVANTLPQESLAYPLYYFAKALGIYDRQISIIIIFSVIQSAFGTYLMSSVFSAFPREILEASMVDGCNKGQALVRIVAPVAMPTLLVLFTFFFIWTWNEFFLPLIMLISDARQTVPIAISVTQGQHNMDATAASASALLGMLPCVLFFFAFQRTLTRGVAAGSVK
jgi:raffinose/stachyose/melibiose transport system permease protein